MEFPIKSKAISFTFSTSACQFRQKLVKKIKEMNLDLLAEEEEFHDSITSTNNDQTDALSNRINSFQRP
jgi:hypothetical protein